MESETRILWGDRACSSHDKSHKTFIAAYSNLVLTLAFVAFASLNAQTIPQKDYLAMRWRLVGPFRAGRALAAAGVPGNPYTFYFGSVDGGVWKTTNAALTWKEISGGQMNPSVGALAIAPSDPKVIYVGTGEADMRSDMTTGDGVYRSTDGGLYWKHLGLEDTQHIGKILIDPHNPDLVLVAALGHAYNANNERGVFRTTDGGKTWDKVLYKGPDVGAIDLAWDPDDPSVVFATMWQARRPPWSQYPPDQGPGGGLYKSTDEGKTWTELEDNGLPPRPYGRIGVSVATGSGGMNVYALVSALKSGSGLYHSTNGGETWTLTSNDPRIVTRMWYFGRVFVDPQNAQIIYVPNRSLMRSTDGGKTFNAIKGSPGGDDYHYLWIDPTDDHRMIVASDQGVVASFDDGKTWSSWYNQPTAQFYHVAVDNRFPYRIYGCQQDAGSVCIKSRSDYGSITFRDWHPVGAGESGYIAPDPLRPNIVYGGDTYGAVYRFNMVTGQSQVVSPSPLAEFSTPAPERRYRFTWTSPIVFDKRDPHILYLGAQVLLKTDDGGLHWKAISPDLTQAGLRVKSADTSHVGWGVIYTVAPSPVRSGLIWAGSDDGLIHVTTDGGKHWANVTPKGLTPWSKISLIEASPFEAGEAYAAVDRRRLGDMAPYIYRTTDFGRTWTLTVKGIGATSYVHVVRADHTRKGLLYAGTENGVYVSFNDGNSWQPLQLNLPVSSIRDLAVHDNDLIAATHGRSFWVLDDITPLQQLTQKVVDSGAYLFKPETTVRIRRSINKDTPLPPEIPQGKNPPAGAILDYYLRTAPSGPVTLDIFDNAGNLVRHFSSEAVAPKPDSPPYFMNAWLPKFKPLTARAGLNRFVWDLRYSSPPSSGYRYSMAVANLHSARVPQGPLVLPGTYKVVLKVDGHTYSRLLKVVMDPRVHVSDLVLRDQLGLAIDVWNDMSDAFALKKSMDTLQAQIQRVDSLTRPATEARSLLVKLGDELSKIRSSMRTGELGGLEGDIMSADREPTQQMRQAYRMLSDNLRASERSWGILKDRTIPGVNRVLRSTGLPTLRLIELMERHLSLPRGV